MMGMRRAPLAVGLVWAAVVATMQACVSSGALKYYDGPAYERPETAREGWRECGYLLDGRREGHWIEYRVENTGIWIRSSAFFKAGKEVSATVILSRGGRVQDLVAFDAAGAGVQDGFLLSWNVGEGRLRSFGLWRDGKEQGWHYSFEAQTRIFFENGAAIVRLPMSPEDARDLDVFRDRPPATDGPGR